MDERPVSTAEMKALFGDLADALVLVLAVSGGPDSTALLLLAARWRAALKSGPKLLAVTIDHRLRPESAREARDVAKLALRLGVTHRTLRWNARKPRTGLQAAARAARYGLLADAARAAGATHILTAHTLDDQAETVLMRLTRGSGIAGLGAMARTSSLPAFMSALSPLEGEGWGGGSLSAANELSKRSPSRRASRIDLPLKGGGEMSNASPSADRLLLVRPLLDVPKSRLLATLKSARIPFADDPSNRNPKFTRVRLRALMPALAQEGLTPPRLSLLARRLARANAALERAADAAYHDLLQIIAPGPLRFDAAKFLRQPEEIALRVLGRAIAERGNEGPVELGKLESLYSALTDAPPGRFARTLAGALVTIEGDSLLVDRAPSRRRESAHPLTKHKGGGRKVTRRQ